MAVEAKSLVPVIDVSALMGSDATKKRETAMTMRRACEDIGFLVVVNHGVPKEVVDACWRKTEEFFDSPMEDKRQLVSEDAAKDPYGYSAFGGETLALGKAAEKEGEAAAKKKAPVTGDLKEMFCIGPSNPGAQMAPRRFPTRPEGFASAWEAYYDEVHKLAQRILGAFAISLGLQEDWFEDKMDRHCSALRANNYLNQDGMTVPEGSISAAPHTRTTARSPCCGPAVPASKSAKTSQITRSPLGAMCPSSRTPSASTSGTSCGGGPTRSGAPPCIASSTHRPVRPRLGAVGCPSLSFTTSTRTPSWRPSPLASLKRSRGSTIPSWPGSS
jgi:hypothetical protein